MRKGFSLIELLVVIGVISILAGILMPTLSLAKRQARTIVCRSNLRQAGLALRMYLNAYNDVMPYAAQMPSQPGNTRPAIADALKPYLDDPEALRCPEDVGNQTFETRSGSYYLERPRFETEKSSYEYMSLLGGRRTQDTFLTERFGEQNTFVMYDYDPVHGKAGRPGAKNYLFADGHAGELKAVEE